jgi:hypothetical protein
MGVNVAHRVGTVPQGPAATLVHEITKVDVENRCDRRGKKRNRYFMASMITAVRKIVHVRKEPLRSASAEDRTHCPGSTMTLDETEQLRSATPDDERP